MKQKNDEVLIHIYGNNLQKFLYIISRLRDARKGIAMVITVDALIQELLKTVGIECSKTTFKAIAGSVQDVRTITIHSLGLMVRCLAAFNWFSIELDEPIIIQEGEPPFRINTVTILLHKTNTQLRIENIYTDEEEAFPETNWIERAKKRLSRWKPAIDLLLTFSKIFESLLALTSN